VLPELIAVQLFEVWHRPSSEVAVPPETEHVRVNVVAVVPEVGDTDADTVGD
jgi:hypothetical protein